MTTPDVIFRGEGPYPSPCDECSAPIEAAERYAILQDGRVLHEVCLFLLTEENGEGPSDLPEA